MLPQLPLLPASGLESSLLVVVLAGVLLLFYLCEVFGWAYSGLVIPGYLASVFVVSPGAGVTVLVEAALTAVVVAAVSDLLGATGVWTRFFGRERFLLVVLVSILVRQSSEVWLWPATLDVLAGWTGVEWIPVQDAHSVGLVLVPLVANAFGKGGASSVVRQVLAPTALAFLLLRVLLEGTNLSLGQLSLTYEDVALDFLQSGRAYFVLATGACLATLFNAWFAWSAGGILIPALLGLLWFEPTRVAATCAEAVIVAWAWRGLTQLPVVRHWNLEGPRKLTGIFLLVVLGRLLMAWAHELGAPIEAHDLAGFGYLLTALVAQKVLQVGSAPTVIVPAVFTSWLGFLGGSAGAWAVEQVAPYGGDMVAQDAHIATPRLLDSPEGTVEYARARVRLDPRRSPSSHLPAASLAAWRRFWEATDETVGTPDAALPALPGGLRADPGAGTIGDRAYVVVREQEDDLDRTAGWGVSLVRLGANGPAILVNRPWSDADGARAALATCAATDCAIVHFGGVELPSGRDDAREALRAALRRPTLAPVPQPAAPDGDVPTVRVGDWLTARLALPYAPWVAARVDLEVLAEDVVPALAAWARGEVGPGAVAARARPVGFSVALDPACGPDPCLALLPDHDGPLVVVRSGEAAPTLVEIGHPRRELGTPRLGLGIFASENARALVVDLAEPDRSLPLQNDPMQALHLAWRRALAGDGALTLLVRGLGEPPVGEPRPAEDAVVGAGRPILGAPPERLAALAPDGRLGRTWTVRWAAAGDDERGLAGNHVSALQADLSLGGVTPAVIWLSETARRPWRSETREATAEWVGAAGLALSDGSGAAPVEEGGAIGSTAAGTLDELGELAGRAAHQHQLNLLRRLVERAHGRAAVNAYWDPERQLAFLEVSVADKGRRAAVRTWLCEGDGRRVVAPPTTDRRALEALLGWAPADLRIGGAP